MLILHKSTNKYKIEKSIPLFRLEYVYRPDSDNSDNSDDSGRNKSLHSPEFFMTYSVPIFGTDRNIPTVPAGTKRSLEPWSGG